MMNSTNLNKSMACRAKEIEGNIHKSAVGKTFMSKTRWDVDVKTFEMIENW